MELKWILLIAMEALAWVLTAGFVVLRYWFRRERASAIALAAMLVDTAGILVLGVVDWALTGEFSPYQVVVAALLVYACTWGRRDMKRLDAWLGERVGRLRERYDARRLSAQRS